MVYELYAYKKAMGLNPSPFLITVFPSSALIKEYQLAE
jgi:hypothetical protein